MRAILRLFRNFIYLIIALGALGIVVAITYAVHLDHQYRLSDEGLNGALWSLPARVYARPLELYQGADVDMARLEQELNLLGYREVSNLQQPSTYSVNKNTLTYYAPQFVFWDGVYPLRKIAVTFAGHKVAGIRNVLAAKSVVIEKLNPMQIASIYPEQREDRILVSLKEVPPVLIDGLVALEDQSFWQHHGIDPKGILRAMYVTFIKHSGYQGASTLTQQFIKNHYLSDERTLSRKIKEILMALTLELHATKAQILEGYLNEIYLGQDGRRAIHGFGLASEFFFNKPLQNLKLHEIAMLLALVREPGPANPNRHPEYALKRRNLVLDVMAERGLISYEDAVLAQSLPLDVVDPKLTSERIRYPAFIDTVMKQLQQHYNKEDLSKGGLNIFTTLDPVIQEDAQKSVTDGLPKLEKNKGLAAGFLQASSIVVNSANGEILSMVGSRTAGEYGFNRAIQASRQIGSVIKPAVYLSALEWPQLYTLATMIDDAPLEYQVNGELWSPKNYDRQNHGAVMLINALAHSYNIPTARIALSLGVQDILGTLRRLGARDKLPAYPSIALGAVEMSPLEVAQIYETIANGGYYTPLRTIRQITTKEGKIIERFPLTNIKAIEPGPHYLLIRAMQEVVRSGTAKSINAALPASLALAGKTGTTDSYRDSWFAGFSGNILNVVWVGNDDNKSTKLSGASGALPIWISIMKSIPQKPLLLPVPQGIVAEKVNVQNGRLAGANCSDDETMVLPFISGSQPTIVQDCVDEQSDTVTPQDERSPYFPIWGGHTNE